MDVQAQWLSDHNTWWKNFWDTSFIELQSGTGEAEYEERLWYVNLYALACGMGGAYPLRFNGGTFLLDKDSRAWDYGYWGQNMRLVYYSMLAAGHFAFVREYIDWYLGNQRFVAAQTKALFGIDGLAWRETQSFWGADTASTLAAPNEQMHNHFTNNLEFCLLMESYYRATGDEEFLRDHLYPALRGILEFFRAYAVPGADGKVHIQPACAVEVWSNMIDPQSEICGLHYFLPRAIEWGTRFGESGELIEFWRDFAATLPDVPIGRWHYESSYDQGIHDRHWLTHSELSADGIYLPAAGGTKARTLRTNMENAELYIVFPWGMVNLDSPESERRRFENTWNHRTWKLQNNGWAQDTVQLARMGWREEFRLALKDHANRSQRFPNGLFISPGPNHFHDLITDTPYFDTAGVHLTALQEMFLQSYDGVLKLAPAVPLSWSGSCKLYAADGFLVELQVRQGLPVSATITATRDGVLLRVKNHRFEPMIVRDGTRAETVVESAQTLGAHLGIGQAINIEWAGVAAEPLAKQVPPDVMWPDYKMRGPLAAYRYGQWHDERRNHGQIGLMEDGLFPATRRPESVSGR